MGGGDGLFEIEIYIPKMNVITFAPKKNTRGNRCMLEGQHDPLLKTHSLMLTNIPQWCWMSWERLCMGVGVGGDRRYMGTLCTFHSICSEAKAAVKN